MFEFNVTNVFPKKLKRETIFAILLIFWLPFSLYITYDYFYGAKIRKENTLLIVIEKMNSLGIEPGVQYYDDEDYQSRYYQHKFLLEQVKVLIKDLQREDEYKDFIKEHEGIFNILTTRKR